VENVQQSIQENELYRADDMLRVKRASLDAGLAKWKLEQAYGPQLKTAAAALRGLSPKEVQDTVQALEAMRDKKLEKAKKGGLLGRWAARGAEMHQRDIDSFKPFLPEQPPKTAGDMPHFTAQDRPAKVKEIYRALKRAHPSMPSEEKARIAARQGKPGKQKQGPPYKAPIKEWHEKKSSLSDKLAEMQKESGIVSQIGTGLQAATRFGAKQLGSLGHTMGTRFAGGKMIEGSGTALSRGVSGLGQKATKAQSWMRTNPELTGGLALGGAGLGTAGLAAGTVPGFAAGRASR
jgi:hypothetical protein